MGRARSVAATAGVLVVAVALVVLAGFAGAGYYNLSTAEAAQLSRTQLRQLAFDAVPKVFGFDYQTVEASMTEAEGLLTPAYRTEFAERAKTDIIPAARERRLVTQVTVTGAGVLDAHRDTGSVLVFMNRTVTDKRMAPQRKWVAVNPLLHMVRVDRIVDTDDGPTTEPLSADQLASISWSGREGISDTTNSNPARTTFCSRACPPQKDTNTVKYR